MKTERFAIQFEMESHLTAMEIAVFINAVLPTAFDIVVIGDSHAWEHPGSAMYTAAQLKRLVNGDEETEGAHG